jgi:hypothetical protein
VRSGQQGLRGRSATFLVLKRVFREGLSKNRKAIIGLKRGIIEL